MARGRAARRIQAPSRHARPARQLDEAGIGRAICCTALAFFRRQNAQYVTLFTKIC